MKSSLTERESLRVINHIRREIHRYFKAHHLKYAIFGKSEGVDSSVIAGLLSAIPEVRPIGVLMPIESHPDAARIGQKVLKHFKIPYLSLDLTPEFHQIAGKLYQFEGLNDQLIEVLKKYRDRQTVSQLPHKKARALGNIKARLRMITLYHLAQLTGGIVISTDNYSEYWMGFWTLNGDVGDLAPIQQVFKGAELYSIAKALGVPKISLETIPTDGLDVIPGGTDQDQLKLPYPELDQVIIKLLRKKFDQTGDQKVLPSISRATGISQDLVQDVANRLVDSSYKRKVPIQFAREKIGLSPVG